MFLYIYFLSQADDVKMPYTLPFTFYNLKNLMLSMDFTEMRPILFMFTLLRSCDNLQKLEIEVILDVYLVAILFMFTLFEGHLVIYN
jgi:hypothetical protein